jgi:hypothetical protein
MLTLERLDEAWLVERMTGHPTKRCRANFHMHTIYCATVHMRHLWLLRGALGLASGPWPHQHVA